MKSIRSKASLESENAELRERVKLLEAVVQRLVAPKPPQFVPMPCPWPHYAPAPAIVPYVNPQWPLPGTITICGASGGPPAHWNGPIDLVGALPLGGTIVNAGSAAQTFLGTEAFVWNANPTGSPAH